MKKLIISLGLALISPVALGMSVSYQMVVNYVPNPPSCSSFINSGALYMDVNPGLPDSMNGGLTPQAFVNNNYTVRLINAHPGYTMVVPRLDENVFCSARCSIANSNCLRACKFAVNVFSGVQTPTYTVPNGTIFVKCPNLNMIKYPNFPSDPYTKYSIQP